MALIGSIAINMSVQAQQLVKGLNTAAVAVKDFGAGAAKSVAASGNLMVAFGRATAGVVKDYYIAPFKGLASYAASWGKVFAGAINDHFVAPVKGLASHAASWGKVFAGAINDHFVAPVKGFGKWMGDWGDALKARFGGAIGAVVRPFAAIGGVMATTAKGAGIVGAGLGRVALAMGRVGLAAGGMGLKAAVGGLRMIGAAAGFAVGALRKTLGVMVQLGKIALVGGGIAGAALFKVAKAASSLTEQTNHAEIIFGKYADTVIAKANLMATAFGTSKTEFISASADLGGMFKGMGYAAEDSAKLATHFTQLAMDTASAVQISTEEAMTRMISGLKGESEAVARWGVDLTEANLKIQAVNKGIAKQGQELTQTQKIQVRTILMDEKLAYAKGDLAKTADTAENAAKGLMGRLENLAATIGTTLLPVVGPALSEIQVGVEALGLAWADWTASVVGDQGQMGNAIMDTSHKVGWFQKSVGFVANAFQVLKSGWYSVQSVVTKGMALWIRASEKVATALGGVMSKITGKKYTAGSDLGAMADDLDKLAKEQGDKGKAEWEKPWASEGIDEYFDKARDKIKEAREEAGKYDVKPVDIKPTATDMPAKAVMPKFASAMEAGSKEAASTILRSRFGGGPAAGGPEMQTAKNTAVTNQHLSRLVNILSNPAGAAGGGLGNLLAVNL